MLEIEHLRVAYGNVEVLHDVSVAVAAGEFVAIVGPNGAGKSTLFNAISGVAPARGGAIRFDGEDLLALAPAKRARAGIAHVPEGRQVFPSLTVLENLEMGAYARPNNAGWTDTLTRIYEWFPVLSTRSRQRAGTLSGGEQQMLAIGRGLASSPRLLMLDEPSMGLSPAFADEIFERIVEIHRREKLAVLLVEQRVAEAVHFADRGYVLESGRVILEGTRETFQNDDRIRAAYLGM
jgi:branched-chain amino acid transport system ATP-binding protein